MVVFLEKRKTVMFAFLVSVSLLLLIGVSFMIKPKEENNNEFVEPKPPQPTFFFQSMTHVNVTGEQRTNVLDIAVNDPEVKQWLGKGYEIAWVYDITDPLALDKDIYYVGILTQEQKLPYVIGISMRINVNVTMKEVTQLHYEIELGTLNEKQKEDTTKIAVNYVEENYGTDYLINGHAKVLSWEETRSGKEIFYAYPSMSFRVPSDYSQPGILVYVYVDLNTEQVVHVFPTSSKPIFDN